MLNMNITVENGKVIFALDGRLDTITAPELENELKASLNGVNELTLDLGGARRFQDPEGDREITAEPARAREEYLLRLREFQKRVRQACVKQGVPLAQLTALDNLGEVLSGVL